MDKITDLLGNEITVGSFIVYSTSKNFAAKLILGYVNKIYENHNKFLKIKVCSVRNICIKRGEITKIVRNVVIKHSDRIVVVPFGLVYNDKNSLIIKEWEKHFLL